MIRAILALLVVAFIVPAYAVKIQKLECFAQNKTKVEVTFVRAIDPLNPWIGTYNFGAQLEVFSSRGIYGRTDMRMSPLQYTTDIDMRGDAAGLDGGAVYLRLSPIVSGGNFSGQYRGQLFVNDLDAKAYFNFRDAGNQPGLTCTAQ
ncbi:hypothetical protein [Bdellovibrio sp. HCB2-146]|uniref:hypothetical protein n=1 Tax=Bdellovibrio sp. HCB2-146 TaxID=3394362 RepID=UPI0039BC527E